MQGEHRKEMVGMRFKGRRILVTGSAGFVGSHLVRRLEQEGAEVTPVDVISGIDVADWGQVKDYRNIDIIYHLAARTYVPDAIAAPRETYRANLDGTLNMLELGRGNRVRRFIFASSYVYGVPQYLPTDEKHPVNPTNPYNRSKAMGEDLCRAYSEDFGLKCVVLRPFNIYGEGQRGDFLIPTILRQAPSRVIVLQSPEPKRDLLYIQDAVDAYLRAAEYAGPDFDIFNIGTGKSYSVAEVVTKTLAAAGRDAEVRYHGQSRKNDIANTVADITKAREKLDWKPRFDLDEGLARTVAGGRGHTR